MFHVKHKSSMIYFNDAAIKFSFRYLNIINELDKAKDALKSKTKEVYF